MHFVLSDFGLEFHLGFSRGEVSGGLGGPDNRAEVLLKMKADILDGIFTGRLNPTGAALSGKISFTGDTVKAMTFQRIQKDLKRLYVEARKEIGDPGDLTGPDTVAAVQAPSKRIPSAQAGDTRDEILMVLSEMYDAGLITSTGGNVSARVPGSGDEIYITPGQIFKGALLPSMVVRLDREGNPTDGSSLSPSSERLMHCAIYNARPDVEAIIHSHAPHATMLALAGLEFLPISTEAAFIGEIPRTPFIMPGTQELADAVAGAMGRGVAVLMQNHGLIVAGGSLRRAADMTLIIEQTAEMIVTCRKLGKKPPVLPKETVAMLRELGDLRA
jgi:autoinducer 2 (AI-2) kinase